MEQHDTKRAVDAKRRAIRGVGVALIGGLALLLWARLKLVTDTPRMVYADPPLGAADDGAPAPGEPGRSARAPGRE